MQFRVCIVAATVFLSPASAGMAADSVPAPAAQPAADEMHFCPVSPRILPLDRYGRLYAVELRGLTTGAATGTIALYSGDARYDIAMRDATVASELDQTTVPTPIVVRFATNVRVDGAVVRSLDDDPASCTTAFAPWQPTTPNEHNVADLASQLEKRRDEEFMAAARRATPVDAPASVHEPRPCTAPDRRGETISTIEPKMPMMAAQYHYSGTVAVLVILRPDGTVANTVVLRPSGHDDIDREAKHAAAVSKFRGATFRCRDVVGLYQFLVDFWP